MVDLKEFAESRSAVLNCDPRGLKIKDGLNSRDLTTPDNRDHIEWLAASIAERGVEKPLVIFAEGDSVYVSDGHCRLTATLLAIERGADIKTVPCVPERRGTNNVDRLLSQFVHNSGKQLTPLEQGVLFKRALGLGASVAQVAASVGKSDTYVSQMIDFQAAPAEVHNMVKAGEVSTTLAARVVREAETPEEGLEKLKKAKAEAAAAGKSRVTAKSLEAEDSLWAELRRAVPRQRPKGVSNARIRAVLRALKEG
jgi:ParB family chromosome partitioning protein